MRSYLGQKYNYETLKKIRKSVILNKCRLKINDSNNDEYNVKLLEVDGAMVDERVRYFYSLQRKRGIFQTGADFSTNKELYELLDNSYSGSSIKHTALQELSNRFCDRYKINDVKIVLKDSCKKMNDIWTTAFFCSISNTIYISEFCDIDEKISNNAKTLVSYLYHELEHALQLKRTLGYDISDNSSDALFRDYLVSLQKIHNAVSPAFGKNLFMQGTESMETYFFSPEELGARYFEVKHSEKLCEEINGMVKSPEQYITFYSKARRIARLKVDRLWSYAKIFDTECEEYKRLWGTKNEFNDERYYLQKYPRIAKKYRNEVKNKKTYLKMYIEAIQEDDMNVKYFYPLSHIAHEYINIFNRVYSSGAMAEYFAKDIEFVRDNIENASKLFNEQKLECEAKNIYRLQFEDLFEEELEKRAEERTQKEKFLINDINSEDVFHQNLDELIKKSCTTRAIILEMNKSYYNAPANSYKNEIDDENNNK